MLYIYLYNRLCWVSQLLRIRIDVELGVLASTDKLSILLVLHHAFQQAHLLADVDQLDNQLAETPRE